MIPDYSPAMLRGFLAARITLAEHLAGSTEAARRNARRTERTRIRTAAAVSDAVIAEAIGGRLKNAALRVRIWGALGVVPAVLEVSLDDDGGQHPPAGASTERSAP